MTNPLKLPVAKEEVASSRLLLSAVVTSAGMKYPYLVAAGPSQSCDLSSSAQGTQDDTTSMQELVSSSFTKDDSKSLCEKSPTSLASTQHDADERTPHQASSSKHRDDVAPAPSVSSEQAEEEIPTSASLPVDTEQTKKQSSSTSAANTTTSTSDDKEKQERRAAKLGRVLRNLESALVGAEDLSQKLFPDDSSFTTSRKLRSRSPNKVSSTPPVSRDNKRVPGKKQHGVHKRTPKQIVSKKKPASKHTAGVKTSQCQVTRSKVESYLPTTKASSSSVQAIPTKRTLSRHAKTVAMASIRDTACGHTHTNSHSPEKMVSSINAMSSRPSKGSNAVEDSLVSRMTTTPNALCGPDLDVSAKLMPVKEEQQDPARKHKEEQVTSSSKKQKISNHHPGHVTVDKLGLTLSATATLAEERKPSAPTSSSGKLPSLAPPELPEVPPDSTKQHAASTSDASKTSPGMKSSIVTLPQPRPSFRPIAEVKEVSSEPNLVPTTNASSTTATGRTVSVTPDPCSVMSICSTSSDGGSSSAIAASSAQLSEDRCHRPPFPAEIIDHNEMQTYFSNLLEFGDGGEQVELPPLVVNTPAGVNHSDDDLEFSFKPLLVFSSHSIIEQPLATILLDESMLEE